MLSGPKFLAVLKEVRRMFDYIIIDAPPLGIFTDASVLINRADAALIVARAGTTRYAALEKLLEPLPRERLLGVILNGSDEQLNEQNYYYRRRYSARRDEGGGGER
jgi:Mrp family chromosome partitioning ATPase